MNIIWEEKNYTEQEKNSLSSNEIDQKNSMKNIEKGSYPKECNDTGKRRKTTKQFTIDSKKVHGNRYIYKIVNYINSQTKVIIVCKKHGEFLQSPNSHLNGRGCPKCIKNSVITTGELIEKAIGRHGNKYDYSKTDHHGNSHKIEIVCRKHGPFWQGPYQHVCGHGCPKCKVDSIKNHLTSNVDEFVLKAKKIHGNKYDYSLCKYSTSRNPVEILCSKHGNFFQKPNTHLNGHGCPTCTHRVSKPEVEFLDYCKIPNKDRQVRIEGILTDAFHKNIVYEFLGDWWHGNPKLFDHDKIHPIKNLPYKELYKKTIDNFNRLTCIGYKVKYVWEMDWKNWKKNNFVGKNPTKIYKKCAQLL